MIFHSQSAARASDDVRPTANDKLPWCPHLVMWAIRILLLAKRGDDQTRHRGPGVIYDWLVAPTNLVQPKSKYVIWLLYSTAHSFFLP